MREASGQGHDMTACRAGRELLYSGGGRRQGYLVSIERYSDLISPYRRRT